MCRYSPYSSQGTLLEKRENFSTKYSNFFQRNNEFKIVENIVEPINKKIGECLKND